MNTIDFIAGWVGGAMGLFASQPLDTVKARMQFSGQPIRRITRSLYRTEGVLGFYRGCLFPLMTAGLYYSVFFGVYGTAKGFLEFHKTPQQIQADKTFNLCVASGIGAVSQIRNQKIPYPTIASTAVPRDLKKPVSQFDWVLLFFLLPSAVLCSCPVEVVKIRQQVEREQPSIMRVLSKIIQIDGPLGLFRGMAPMMCCEVPISIIYILIYDHISAFFAKNDKKSVSALNSFLSGGVAGTCACVPAIPFDVIQTKMMADRTGRYLNMRHCIKETLKADGIRGLFHGGGLFAVRAFPTYAAIFLGYEQTKTFLNKVFRHT